MIHADLALARRLEALICAEFRRLAEIARTVLPGVPAECVDVADGVALWLGAGSPVNVAAGVGVTGPVDDQDLALLEDFFTARGETPGVSICPLADQSLIRGLSRRGWRASGFEHLLALELDGARPSRRPPEGSPPPEETSSVGPSIATDEVPGLEVRVCRPGERAMWGETAARGFADGRSSERGHEEFGRIMAARDDALLVMAWVGDEPAGTGSLVIDGGVGWLAGDSTLPRFRRRGIQTAIQRHRLELARDAGCDLAVTEAVPGSDSKRNMERQGFRIVYTHVEFVRDQAHRQI